MNIDYKELQKRIKNNPELLDDNRALTNSLASIVNAYPNVWKNPKLMNALLMDYYPEDKLTRNLIFSSVEEKIPHDIVGLKVCSKSDYRRFVKRLTDSYGCVETKAEEIIGLWLKALAVSLENTVSNKKTNTEITENKNTELEALNIDELEFNVRTYNALKRAGISTVGDLMRLSAADMVDIRNLGRKSFEEILRKMKSLGCVIDSHFEEEYYEQWHKKIEERRLEANRFSFSDAYDDFISKNKNSGMWDFDDVIIHRKLNRGQYVNTYFCQYDNPPIEIFNFIAKKDGNIYEMRVGVWNLSNETRNQPIKIRYEIATRQGSHIHDCVDTVTPAPKSQYLVINFEYDGEEKPIFRIIE